MQVRIENHVLYVSGDLVFNGTDPCRLLRRKVALLRRDQKQICVDLSKVRKIDDVGLGDLLSTHLTLARSGVELICLRPSQAVVDILRPIGTCSLEFSSQVPREPEPEESQTTAEEAE